ncbi:hypothetical protein Dimus_012004 [Dionaea muscipula]
MKLIDSSKKRETEKTGGRYENGGGDGGGLIEGGSGRKKVVVVGVKFDQQSTEILTWALVHVAHPGDLVVALHVLETFNEKQSTLLTLVQTFDSVLSVYEGLCHLKQVELKLKVLRGPSARKLLVREAKHHESAAVVVGTSKAKTLPVIRSPISVAKYCASKLSSHKFLVIAVGNGRAVFRREASANCYSDEEEDGQGLGADQGYLKKTKNIGSRARKSAAIKKYFGCAPTSKWKKDFHSNLQFPLREPDQFSVSVIGQEQSDEIERGWPLLRKEFLLLPKQPILEKATTGSRLSRIRMRHFLNAVHSDHVKHGDHSAQEDLQYLSTFNGVNGGILLSGSSSTASSSSSPRSPNHEFDSLQKTLAGLHEKCSSTCRLFSLEELVSATSNFLPECLVGKGGSSQVFRGSLPDGQELAVKILKPTEDVLSEFITEIEIITAINHKNIISLLGYCFEDNNLILVYDYLPRGSLEDNLHGNKKDDDAFGWEQRYKVAVGVAEALGYLHNECSQPVIHRDVKSSNILLSCDFQPQLADFGLASWASNDSSYKVYTDVAGTFGYLAPEYFMHGKVTEKIDVYAYGVVLLELLSGRKPIDGENPKGPESLVKWATPILQDGKISQLLDPSMGSDYDHHHIERMVLAATLCISRAPQCRPGISHVLKLLRGDVEVTNWAKQQIINGSTTVDINTLDGETLPNDVQSLLNMAFLDIEDDALSVSSPEQNNISISLEEYLQGRWSRSPSFH